MQIRLCYDVTIYNPVWIRKKTKLKIWDYHIQCYLTEVKQLEEILALREREQKELLDQYQHMIEF